MKAVRFNFHQSTANYRNPTGFNQRPSYPLPPFSTVIGMVHNLCEFTSYHPMQVGIKGKYEATNTDLQTIYEFGNLKFDAKRHHFSFLGTNSKDQQINIGVTRGLAEVELLWNINLSIVIAPEDEEDIQHIFKSLSNPREYPSLGRREDIGALSDVELIDIELTFLEEELEIEYPGWIPPSLKSGTTFLLNKDYTIVEYRKNKKIRNFNKVSAAISTGSITLQPGTPLYMINGEEDVTFLF